MKRMVATLSGVLVVALAVTACAIRDTETGMTLFHGRVLDPTA